MSGAVESETVQQKRKGVFEDFRFPIGGWIILIHEVLERFSFYGTKTILTIYMNEYLGFSNDNATIIYHLFQGFSYFTPILGAIIADNTLGRFRTVIVIGFVYFLGHLLMTLTSISRNIPGPLIGMFVLAFGAGGIKSSVAAFGGDQIPTGNSGMVEKYFSLFYTAINLGAFAATFITPILSKDVACVNSHCYPLGFGVPASVFLVTYILFIAGRKTYNITESSKNVFSKFVGCAYRAIVNFFKDRRYKRYDHVLDYAQTHYSKDFIFDCRKAWKIILIFSPIMIFWALYDQQGSRWTLQAKLMDGRLGSSFIIKPEQIQAFNPLLIIGFIPFFDFVVYPICNKLHIFTKPTSKLITSYMISAISFSIAGFIQMQIINGQTPDFTVAGSKLNIFNQAPNCTLQTSLHNKLYSVPSDSYLALDLPPGIQSASMNCGAHKSIVNFTLEKSQMNSAFVYIRAGKLKLDFWKSQLNKSKGNGRIRFVDIGNVSDEGIFIKLEANGVNLTRIDSNYTSIGAGYYVIYCKNSTAVKCGKMQILPGEVKSIVKTSNKSRALLVMEFEPHLVHMLWQLPQYVLMTCAEILCSITALSIAYSEAPDSMKSLMQAVYLVTIFGGNIIVVIVTAGISGVMSQTVEFFFFAGLVVAAGFVNWLLIRFVSTNQQASPTATKNSDSTEMH